MSGILLLSVAVVALALPGVAAQDRARTGGENVVAPPYDLVTRRWHRLIPHNAKLTGWTLTPSHALRRQLDTAWLAE